MEGLLLPTQAGYSWCSCGRARFPLTVTPPLRFFIPWLLPFYPSDLN